MWSKPVQMIQVANLNDQYTNTYANLKAYRTVFKESQGSSYVTGPFFYDNCELYGSYINMYQSPTFTGDNIILDDVTLHGLRYGLTISLAASRSIKIKDVYVQSSRIINGPGNAGKLYIFDLELRYTAPASVLYLNYVYNTQIHFVDVKTTFKPDWTRSRYGIDDNTELWIDWRTKIKTIDSYELPIEGTIINIKQVNGEHIPGSPFVTNSTGDIYNLTSQYKYMKDGTYMTDETDFNPHTISIEKNGFQTFEFEHNFTEPIEWTIPLKKFEFNLIAIHNDATEMLVIT